MRDEHTEELASLYVLGLLGAEESRVFEEQMAGDPSLVKFVDDLREGAASLVVDTSPLAPPVGLKGRLLEKIGRNKVIPFKARTSWLPWALAAGFAILAGVLALDRLRLQHDVVDLRERVEFSRLRIASLSSLIEGAPNAMAAVAWDAQRQKGILDVRNLPPVDPGHDYQLWVIDPSYEVPVSAGIFRVENGVARMEFKPDHVISSAEKFAVSIEREGGSPKHEGPIVLVGQ